MLCSSGFFGLWERSASAAGAGEWWGGKRGGEGGGGGGGTGLTDQQMFQLLGFLARKGQLRVVLNEAGSHPINCLVQWKSCSLVHAAHPLPSGSPSDHRLHPELEQEVMDQTYEKLKASFGQSYFMSRLGPACVCGEYMYVLECTSLCLHVCASGQCVVMMHILHEVAGTCTSSSNGPEQPAQHYWWE